MWPHTPPRFRPPNDPDAPGPTFHGKDIFAWKVRRSGIAFGGALELALCARWWGYRWYEFEAIPVDEQAFLIAVYRCHIQIDALLAEPQYRRK